MALTAIPTSLSGVCLLSDSDRPIAGHVGQVSGDG